MDVQPFANDLPDRHTWAQATEGVLKDHLHLPPQRPYLALRHALQLLALEADLAPTTQQSKNSQSQRGLAGAALADDTQRLPLGQAEVDAVDCLDVVDGATQQALLDREPHPQVVHFQQWCRFFDRHRTATGLGREQFLGIWMLRCAEQIFTQRLFDDTTALHDTYAMGNAPNQVEVVADQQQRHAQACLQFLEQFEDLQLHGDVECCGRFVGDQQLGLVGQRHGDDHPLPLSARQLVRVGADALARLWNTDQFQQLQGASGCGLAAQALVNLQHLVDLLAHGVQRVERGHWFLEHHGNAITTNFAHVLFVGLEQVLAVEKDLPLRMAGEGVGQQPQDGMRGYRLA